MQIFPLKSDNLFNFFSIDKHYIMRNAWNILGRGDGREGKKKTTKQNQQTI